jgi:hypothetical protein
VRLTVVKSNIQRMPRFDVPPNWEFGIDVSPRRR